MLVVLESNLPRISLRSRRSGTEQELCGCMHTRIMPDWKSFAFRRRPVLLRHVVCSEKIQVL